MTRIRRINVSQVEGGSADNTDIGQIRPAGETAFYIGDNNKLTLMMFDGVRTHQKSKVLSPGVLFGSNADAGDGSTADTIKLIPDSALFNSGSDQYIVVDPTAGGPGHIHLRAGGTQDNSTADLYLGGELTFVRVSDTSDDVVIRTSVLGEGVTNYDWTFDNDGNTTFPGGMSITGVGATIQTITGNNINIETNDTQSVSANCAIAVGDEFVADTEFNNDITVVQVGWTVTIGVDTYVVTSIDPAPPANQYRITAAGATFVQSTTYTFTSPTPVAKTWSFGSTGTLTLPNNAVIRTDGSNIEVGGMTNFNVEAAGVANIYTDDGTHQWQFGDDGALTFPGGATTTGESITVPVDQSLTVNTSHSIGPGGETTFKINPESIKLPTGNGIIFSGTETPANRWGLDSGNKTLFFPNAGDDVYPQIIYSNAATGMELFTFAKSIKITAAQTNSWTFGTDGGLTFPDSTVQTTAYTGTGAITFTANEIEGNTFGGTGTTFSKSVDKDGSDYSTGGGTLPFINMGADSDVDNVRAGWIVTFASGETRTVASDPYKPLGTYWNISFNSSYSWNAGDVMPITFSSPDYVAGTDPQVTLTAGSKSWTFDDAGTLTLPGTMTIETAYGGTPRLVIDSKTNYVDIRSDSNILIGYNESSGNVTIGNGTSGRVDILGPKFRVTATVPTSSTGADGDMVGMIAVGGGYLYVCTANWVSPGTADIWTRTALTTGAW